MKSHTVKAPLLTEPCSVSICILQDISLSFDEIKALIPSLDCALINPKLVASFDQLSTAIMKVLTAGKNMKTRSRYSELLYSLSPSTNVTESLKTFGLASDCKQAIAVRFDCPYGEAFAAELESKLSARCLEYNPVAFESLADIEAIKKLYKLTTNTYSLEICSIIASKGV